MKILLIVQTSKYYPEQKKLHTFPTFILQKHLFKGERALGTVRDFCDRPRTDFIGTAKYLLSTVPITQQIIEYYRFRG